MRTAVLLGCSCSLAAAFVPPPALQAASGRQRESTVLMASREARRFGAWDRLAASALLLLNAACPPALALPAKAPETNAQAILFEALPSKSPALQSLESALAPLTTEGSGNIRSVDAKGTKGIKPWAEVLKAQRAASAVVNSKASDLLAGVKPADKAEADATYAALTASLKELGDAAEQQDRAAAVHAQVTALRAVDRLGALEVKGFPFEVPSEYQGLPRLMGRAEVQLTVRAAKTGKTSQMVALLDGFSAPLTAGAFLDLAGSSSFTQVPVKYTDESSVVFGAKDPSKANKVPLEVLVEGDKEPSYGETLEEQGRFKEKPVLPFNCYGTLAMLHPADDPNGGGSEFMALKFDPAYTPAGLNTLDGAYSVLGYIVEGAEALDDLDKGDQIVDVKVLSGLGNLVRK